MVAWLNERRFLFFFFYIGETWSAFSVSIETDDHMRAIAERVFASETKDENVRDEISMFDVPEDCPILQNELAHHLHTDDNKEKRWAAGWVIM